MVTSITKSRTSGTEWGTVTSTTGSLVTRLRARCQGTRTRFTVARHPAIHHPSRLMRSRDRRLLAGLALAAMLVLALLVHHAGTEALLAAPLLALLAPLLAGRYLGEEHIGRLAAARRAPREHTVARARRSSAVLRAPLVLVPRGGRLLATSLAVRPPPAVAPVR